MADISTQELTIKTTEITGKDTDGAEVYRYRLMRIWDTKSRPLMVIGCNPSNASIINVDPTMNKVSCAAHAAGYGGIIMSNLFAFRTPSPSEMMKTERNKAPKGKHENFVYVIGKENALDLQEAATLVDDVVFAFGEIVKNTEWGKARQNAVETYAREVMLAFHQERKNLFAFALNQSGYPQHPLYLKKNIEDKNGWERIDNQNGKWVKLFNDRWIPMFKEDVFTNNAPYKKY